MTVRKTVSQDLRVTFSSPDSGNIPHEQLSEFPALATRVALGLLNVDFATNLGAAFDIEVESLGEAEVVDEPLEDDASE